MGTTTTTDNSEKKSNGQFSLPSVPSQLLRPTPAEERRRSLIKHEGKLEFTARMIRKRYVEPFS